MGKLAAAAISLLLTITGLDSAQPGEDVTAQVKTRGAGKSRWTVTINFHRDA